MIPHQGTKSHRLLIQLRVQVPQRASHASTKRSHTAAKDPFDAALKTRGCKMNQQILRKNAALCDGCFCLKTPRVTHTWLIHVEPPLAPFLSSLTRHRLHSEAGTALLSLAAPGGPQLYACLSCKIAAKGHQNVKQRSKPMTERTLVIAGTETGRDSCQPRRDGRYGATWTLWLLCRYP